ncbi:pyridoxamine 5'-phosphate oxidase family protein [Anaerorhabdus sp.]|nr:pyridoxamine 5'-phosphate oxidase family protein [Anaerorhabdus sp.]MEA4875757.1 pyridoxamine 5'-phosphate oxidase family protein [Anaerorhabdus sp.]
MSSIYEEGLKLIDEKFGNGKDNLISLATIACETSVDGKPRPIVRCVDAYYEDCTFYVVTYEKSNKMLQIKQNDEVSVAHSTEMFTAIGKGENLGWVLDPKNAEIRTKLRTAFASWYDMANNENDENCCILAIHLTKGTLNINHWEKLYHLDFVNKSDMKDGGIF